VTYHVDVHCDASNNSDVGRLSEQEEELSL